MNAAGFAPTAKSLTFVLVFGLALAACADPDWVPMGMAQGSADPSASSLLASTGPDASAAAPSPSAVGRALVNEEVTADVPMGGKGTPTCPAKVTLSYVPGGGPADALTSMAQLSAICTDRQRMPIDASGTFDGSAFALKEGSATYAGTVAAGSVTIAGNGASFTFPVKAP